MELEKFWNPLLVVMILVGLSDLSYPFFVNIEATSQASGAALINIAIFALLALIGIVGSVILLLNKFNRDISVIVVTLSYFIYGAYLLVLYFDIPIDLALGTIHIVLSVGFFLMNRAIGQD